MSKERLEEIKEVDQEVGNGFAVEDLDLDAMTVVNREHFNWLIEQAEQADDLGVAYDNSVKEISILKYRADRLEVENAETSLRSRGLQMKNKRYRDAIQKAEKELMDKRYPLDFHVSRAIDILVEALEDDTHA